MNDCSRGNRLRSVRALVFAAGAWWVASELAAQSSPTELTRRLQPSEALASFGSISSIDRNTAVVTAPFDEFTYGTQGFSTFGAVAVFERDAGGAWSERALLKYMPNVARPPLFGLRAEVSGSLLAVMSIDDAEGAVWHGQAHLFSKASDGTWTQERLIRGADVVPATVALDLAQDFAFSIALDGNTLAASSGQFDPERISGPVSVFVRTGPGHWALQGQFTPNDHWAKDGFGSFDLDLSGNTLFASAHGARNAAGTPVGAVYVFQRNASGVWSQQAKIPAPAGAPHSQSGFSESVAAGGSSIVFVGASRDDQQAANAGAVYVFTRNTSGQWVQHSKLMASDGAAERRFGQSVAVDGIKAVIGALDRAYVFKQNETGQWIEHERLTLPPDSPTGVIDSVAMAYGTTLVSGSRIGAFVHDLAPEPPTLNKVAGDDCINLAESGAAVAVSGARAEPGATVTVSLGGITKTATGQDNSTWSTTFTPANIAAMAQGNLDLTASQKDIPGGVSPLATRVVCKDTVITRPVINPVTPDNIVTPAERQSGLQVRGSAEGGAAMTVTVGSINKTATAGAGGAWAVSLSAAQAGKLPKGTVTVRAVSRDKAGNSATGTRTFTNR